MPNSVRIRNNITLLSDSGAFSKSINNCYTVPSYSHFSPVPDKCRISDQYMVYYVAMHTDDP